MGKKKSLHSFTSNAHGRDSIPAFCGHCELADDCAELGRFFCDEMFGQGRVERLSPFGFITRSQSLTNHFGGCE